MRNHNKLLKTMKGCDGLKTGFFNAAGFSIAATATRYGHRAIAVMIGAKEQRVRDAKTKELLHKGLEQLTIKVSPPHPAGVGAFVEPVR